MRVAVGLVVAILCVYLWLPPRGTIRHNGHHYRTREPANLPRLEALRHLSLRIVGGTRPSLRRWLSLRRLRRCVFVEQTEDETTTHLALTVDKGRELHICLDYKDEQALRFVLIHELAHVVSYSVGHTPEFYRNMDALLASARAQGIYTAPPDKTVRFCGAHVHLDR